MKHAPGRAILTAFLICTFNAHGQPARTDNPAELVRKEFLHAWNGYKTFAWGHDALRPISRTPYDWYGVPFLMTPVDALDTMILMGLTSEADSTREYIVSHLSFDRDVYVKNFEFTIRLLGGLLSSYQLTGDARLLELARDLGTRLLPAFNTPTGMPYVDVNLRTGKGRGTVTNPAEVGTLLLEFGTLTKLTGDARYLDAAKRSLKQVYARRSRIGLVGEGIDVMTGTWTGTDSHISGCIDSYYEYMVKGARLFGDKDCGTMWDSSIAAIRTYLQDSSSAGLWYGHADMNTGVRSHTWFGSLDAFFPAVLVLSGDIRRAGMLEESCFHMWNLHGIEPEEIDYGTMSVTSPGYPLRPEIIESAYYLFSATHDPRYRAMGKVFLDSLRTYCRTDIGYAGLNSVITKEKDDMMESFFLAETLKYLYLLFAPPSPLDFDTVTINPEAHPLRRTWR